MSGSGRQLAGRSTARCTRFPIFWSASPKGRGPGNRGRGKHFGLTGGSRLKISLGRPGLSDLSPRVFRPPMVWTASAVSDVTLYGAFISVYRFDAWPSDIRWDGDHRYPDTTGCNRFEPKVSLPGHALVMRLAVEVFDSNQTGSSVPP